MAKLFKSSYAFSFPELMAVLAVMGILLAVGVPQYKSYVVRGKLHEVVKVMEGYISQAQSGFLATGALPFQVYGVEGFFPSANGWTLADNVNGSSYISQMRYVDGSTWVNHGAMIQVIVSDEVGNGINGYVAGEAGQYNRIAIAFEADGEVMRVYCGTISTDVTEIPAEYLPGGCDTVDFWSAVTS